MKKECYKLLAAIILMLVATLTSCEKFSLDESGQSSTHDANANVTVRIHQVQNRTIGEVTKATTSGTALQDVCSRVSFVVFDGEEKIETINQASDDANFGIASFSLDEGEYRLVVIAHSGKGNCTMSVPEKVKFTSNKLTDTFYYYGRLSIKSDKVEADVNLQRAVAAFKLHITDETIPEEVRSIKFYYTGGSSTLDATTGYGCVNSRQTEIFNFTDNNRDFTVYAHAIKTFTKSDFKMKRNEIIKTDISLTKSSGGSSGEDDDRNVGLTVDADWGEETVVRF